MSDLKMADEVLVRHVFRVYILVTEILLGVGGQRPKLDR